MSQNVVNNFNKLIDSFLNSNEIKKDISNFDFGNVDIKEITEKFGGLFEDNDKNEVKLMHSKNIKNKKKFLIIKGFEMQTGEFKIWLKKFK